MSQTSPDNCAGLKAAIRRRLRDLLASMTQEERHALSQAACARLLGTAEFASARIVMLYLSTPAEVDTAPIALRCWQDGRTVVVPRVAWEQRQMLPVEVRSLRRAASREHPGIPEPVGGRPVPVNLIDLVIVPGLGFSLSGHRIGRGMGFYDRFLALKEFSGVSCGLAFEQQVLQELPVLDHDVRLAMLVTDRQVRRFAATEIRS